MMWLNCICCDKVISIELKTVGMIEVTKAVCISCSYKYEKVDGKIQKKKKQEWIEEVDEGYKY